MCTRVLWNDNPIGPICGRTMDWPISTDPMLTVFPRGVQRNGASLDGLTIDSNPKRWTARFGSLVVTLYGLGAADGMNEAGFAAHMLYLKSTDFGLRDPSVPGVHAGLWAQYLLDNAANVNEALTLLDGIQPLMVEARGSKATVHLAIEDVSGDSAIIEYLDGRRVVHHGRVFRIMTNDPTYDEQLRLLSEQDYSKPSKDTPLPGNVNAVDRFQRAAYFSALLPEPKSEREAIASVLSIARNCSVPFGSPYGEFGIYNTEYRTVCDLANRRYFFELTTAPNVIWVDAAGLSFDEGSPVLALDPNDVSLSGAVNERFRPIPAPY